MRELVARSFDLIALQEITPPRGASTAHRLADDLGGDSVHVCPKSGWAQSREGIAILSRLPVEDHAVLDLGGRGRTAGASRSAWTPARTVGRQSTARRSRRPRSAAPGYDADEKVNGRERRVVVTLGLITAVVVHAANIQDYEGAVPVGSCWIPGWCDQEAEQRPQNALSSRPDVVDELEKSQVQRQLLLRDPPVRAQPTPQQRPEPFERVDVRLAEPVPVVIPGVLPLGVADRAVAVTPFPSRL